VLFAEREADQSLGRGIGEEHRQLAAELRRQDVQAGEQRTRGDPAGA
jgi:hypothetical protein